MSRQKTKADLEREVESLKAKIGILNRVIHEKNVALELERSLLGRLQSDVNLLRENLRLATKYIGLPIGGFRGFKKDDRVEISFSAKAIDIQNMRRALRDTARSA